MEKIGSYSTSLSVLGCRWTLLNDLFSEQCTSSLYLNGEWDPIIFQLAIPRMSSEYVPYSICSLCDRSKGFDVRGILQLLFIWINGVLIVRQQSYFVVMIWRIWNYQNSSSQEISQCIDSRICRILDGGSPFGSRVLVCGAWYQQVLEASICISLRLTAVKISELFVNDFPGYLPRNWWIY